MLRIVDENRSWRPPLQGLLKRQAQCRSVSAPQDRPRLPFNRGAGNMRKWPAVIEGVLHARFLQKQQGSLVVIAPLELIERGRNRVQSQDGVMPSLIRSSCCRHLHQALFNLCQQRRFPYTSWPEDEDQTAPAGLLNVFQTTCSPPG